MAAMTRSTEVFKCSICKTVQSLILRNLLNLINTVHCNEPNFSLICGVGGCPATFTKYNSFYKHVLKKHRQPYADRNRYEPRAKRTRGEHIDNENGQDNTLIFEEENNAVMHDPHRHSSSDESDNDNEQPLQMQV
ncbi:Hypothetical predicted protein [Paramuricea clavata]|uniref:Uncharacterized protein n=1 Tax=Paramuricea clavata TaxID=317549 RepID=A0A7D9IQX1_PARCT|nr:Hypothetical predicted protein [Paramuricea clavata]